jgi:para-nitrobenzyl esterase
VGQHLHPASGADAADRRQPGDRHARLAADAEDCLNLNVWTPAKYAGEKLPVMVWFYGGAYNEGGGSMPFADGTKLARRA